MLTNNRPQQAISKETFDVIKQTTLDKSVYYVVYKNFYSRPAYFSFASVLRYKEVLALIGFIIF